MVNETLDQQISKYLVNEFNDINPRFLEENLNIGTGLYNRINNGLVTETYLYFSLNFKGKAIEYFKDTMEDRYLEIIEHCIPKFKIICKNTSLKITFDILYNGKKIKDGVF